MLSPVKIKGEGTGVGGEEEILSPSLQTPTLFPISTPDLWPIALSPPVTTSGLFNRTLEDTLFLNDVTSESGEEGLLQDPILNPGTLLDIPDTSPLDHLDPNEVEQLLEEIGIFETKSDSPLPADPFGSEGDWCPMDTPLSPPTDYVLRTLSLEHDYCDPDWKVLSEFLAAPFDSAGAELDSGPSHMDTFVNLEPFLTSDGASEDNGPVSPVEPIQSPEPKPVVPKLSGTGETGRRKMADPRYREKRVRNNIASRNSRRTRKEKRVTMLMEREELEAKNATLKTELERLEVLAAEWKDRLLKLLAE